MELATTLNYKVDKWFLQKRVDREFKTRVNSYGYKFMGSGLSFFCACVKVMFLIVYLLIVKNYVHFFHRATTSAVVARNNK